MFSRISQSSIHPISINDSVEPAINAPLKINSIAIPNRKFYPVSGLNPEKMKVISDLFEKKNNSLSSRDYLLRKIKESSDRKCFLLCEDEAPKGVLVFKTILSNKFAQYDIHRSIEIKSLFEDHSASSITSPSFLDPKNDLKPYLMDKLKQEVLKLDLNENRMHVTLNETDTESLEFFLKDGFEIIHTWTGGSLADVTKHLLATPRKNQTDLTDKRMLTWEKSINDAVDVFLNQVNALNNNLPSTVVAISYVSCDSQLDSTALLKDTTPLLLEKAALHLKKILLQGGVSAHLIPLSDSRTLIDQLKNKTHAIILCTPDYMQKVVSDPEIRNRLEEFGSSIKNALQPLLCVGGFSDVALKIVDRHYLIRPFALALSDNYIHSTRAFIDIVFKLSGRNGLGLLPDILGITDDQYTEKRILYSEYIHELEVAEYKATIDYRLNVALNKSIQEYHIQPSDFAENFSFESLLNKFSNALCLSSAQIELFLCPTKVDTKISSFFLSMILLVLNQRVLIIECGDYPGKTAHSCVQIACQKLGLESEHLQLMKKEPLFIFLNGYENSKTYDNLFVSNQLSTWTNVRLFITCHSIFFQSRSYLRCFLPDISDRQKIEDISVNNLPSFASENAKRTFLPKEYKTPLTEENETSQLSLSLKQQAIRFELKAFLKNLNQQLINARFFTSENKSLFISYAWEADKEALRIQQEHLSHLNEDLTILGFCPWLDIKRMSGDIDQQMAGNIANSHGVVVIGTSRYTERSGEETNVKKEYEAILKKSEEFRLRGSRFNVFPLQFTDDRPFPQALMNHPNICDFRGIDERNANGYVNCLTDPTHGLLPKLLFETPIQLADYKQAYDMFQNSLQEMVGKHLIVNQGKHDYQAYAIDQRLEGYIEPYGLLLEADPLEQRFDLQEYFQKFLESSHTKTMLVLGEAGTGKSSFALFTFKNFLLPWIEYQEASIKAFQNPINRPRWLPLYISLKKYTKHPETCVEIALREQFQLNLEEIEALKQGLNQNQELLFILDGYDELGSGVTPNLTQSLVDWLTAKLLITSRSDHFNQVNSLSCLSLYSSDGRIERKSVNQVYLSSFTPSDIERYIAYYKSEENQDQTFRILDGIPGMMALLDNPFLLTLVLQSLPQLLKNRATDNLSQSVTRTDVYQAFTETWFLQETLGRELTCAACDAFCQELAFRLFQEKIISITDNSTLWVFFNDVKNRAVQDASPLRLSGGVYSFIHKSVYEYFVAGYLWESILKFQSVAILGKKEESAGRGGLAGSAFLPGMTAPLDGISVWQTRFLIEEKGVFDFLVERLATCGTPIKEQKENALLDMVLASRDQPEWAIAASNAITVLNQTGFPFYKRVPNQDLSGICIPYADLTKGRLMGIDCSRMDATGVNFYDAALVSTKLCGANLTGARFWASESIVECSAEVMALHPNRVDIAACEEYTGIIIVDLVEGSIKRRLRKFDYVLNNLRSNYINCLAFSPDGNTLVSGGNDTNIYAWDLTSKITSYKIFRGHTSSVISIAFRQDGLLASGDYDTIRVWDPNRKVAHLKTLEVDWPESLAFSPSGVLASGNFKVNLWDSKREFAHLKTFEWTRFKSLAFGPDDVLALGSGDGTIFLWDSKYEASDYKTLSGGHTASVVSLAFGPDGVLASGSEDQTICLWNPKREVSHLKTLKGHTDPVLNIAFSRGGMLVSGSTDRTVRLWNLKREIIQHKNIGEHTDIITCLASRPEDGLLASGSKDHTIRLWDSKCELVHLKTLEGHTAEVTCLAFRSDGLLASGSHDKTIRLWDSRVQVSHLKTLEGHKDTVTCLAFSPDGLLASGSRDKTIRLWDSKLGISHLKTLEGHKDGVTCLAFSSDGLLASGSWDEIRIWNPKQEFAHLKTLKSGAIEKLTFNSDGLLALTARHNERVFLWGPNGKVLIPRPCSEIIRRHPGEIFNPNILFTPNNRWLIVSNWDGTSIQNTRDWNEIFWLPFRPPSICFHDTFLSLAHGRSIYTLDLADFPRSYRWMMATSPTSWLTTCDIRNAHGLTPLIQKFLEEEKVITTDPQSECCVIS